MEEARFRKQQQEERDRKELEKERERIEKLKEEHRKTKSYDLPPVIDKADEEDLSSEPVYEENIIEKELRIQEEQMRRLAEGLPVNMSYDDRLKGFDAELADKVS